MLRINVRSIHSEPIVILLAGFLVGIFFRFNIDFLNYLGLALAGYIMTYALPKPWLLLIAIIPAFFSLEPVPQKIGFGEVTVSSMLLLFTLATFYEEFKSKNIANIKFIIVGSSIFLSLVSLSCLHSINNSISLPTWFRAVAPFLLWYLMIPISLALREAFDEKIKWVLIAFAALAVALLSWVNFIFFHSSVAKLYWLDQNNVKFLSAENVSAIHQLTGPYRERITIIFSQATSEIIPISFLIFLLVAVFEKRNHVRLASLMISTIALFAILETFTRSMLMSAVFNLILLGIWLLFTNRKLTRNYASCLFFLLFSAVTVVYVNNIESIWLGRLGILVRDLFSSQDPRNILSLTGIHDENITSRLDEYKVAYSIFRDNILFGGGLGIKHNMSFLVSGDNYLHQSVAYVHNWVFYWLMVGGISGLVLYLSLLMLPVLAALSIKKNSLLKLVMLSTVSTMGVYALFFAVFRLFTYNLIIAVICGIAFCILRNSKERSSVTQVNSSLKIPSFRGPLAV